MDYREKFFEKYVSSHTNRVYGTRAVEDLENQFPVWQSYFGYLLPQDKNSLILDVGAGNGDFVHWLRAKGYEHSEGIDVSEEQVRLAERLGIRGIIRADLFAFLRDKPNRYDVIVARDVFEHFTKDEAIEAAELIYSFLKPAGRLIIQTVNAENLLWGRLRHGDFTHELAFTKESSCQLLSVSGFDDIRVYPQRPVIHGLVSLSRAILWRIFELFMYLYLLMETGTAKGIFTQNIIVCAFKDK